jgi:uncharacterized protein YdbL (DUF1318 family)
MWSRKNRFERSLESAETSTAAAVGELADAIRAKVGGDAGDQIAGALTTLATKVDHMDLADQVHRGRKEIEKATKKAQKRVKKSSAQVAALSAQAVPEQPGGWVAPTFFGFLLGFGAGFLVARVARPRAEHEH